MMDSEFEITPSDVKDLKTFTQYCKLSAPTIKKWLEGDPIYKSSLKKVNRALNDCKLTKFDLLQLRRKFKRKRKANDLAQHEFDYSYDFREHSNEFPSISGNIKSIHGHVYNIDTKSVHYLCELHSQSYPHEFFNSQDLYIYNDLNAIRKYWEFKNAFIQE